jgi:hypothetical protein
MVQAKNKASYYFGLDSQALHDSFWWEKAAAAIDATAKN